MQEHFQIHNLLPEDMEREDTPKFLVVEKVAVATTKSEECLEAEEAEVGITEVLELVEEAMASLIRKWN